MSVGPLFTRGNAVVDGDRGWFVGQFVGGDDAGLRRRDDVEVKWGVHPRGERRAGGWARYRTATTISVLIEGTITMWLRREGGEHEITLDDPGDYLILPPGVDHIWEARTDCIVLSIRAPSVPGDLMRPLE